MATTIHFTSGEKLSVPQDPATLNAILGPGGRLEIQSGNEHQQLFVNADQIAYLQGPRA
jgi:hypothetical protein